MHVTLWCGFLTLSQFRCLLFSSDFLVMGLNLSVQASIILGFLEAVSASCIIVRAIPDLFYAAFEATSTLNAICADHSEGFAASFGHVGSKTSPYGELIRTDVIKTFFIIVYDYFSVDHTGSFDGVAGPITLIAANVAVCIVTYFLGELAWTYECVAVVSWGSDITKAAFIAAKAFGVLGLIQFAGIKIE